MPRDRFIRNKRRDAGIDTERRDAGMGLEAHFTAEVGRNKTFRDCIRRLLDMGSKF